MDTLIVTSQKGGAGKTSLARNLGVASWRDGRRTLLLDLDPQQSLREWWDVRPEELEGPDMLDEDPGPDTLARTLDAARPQYDLAIIDTPPAASEWLTGTMALADLVLLPVRPTGDDIRAVKATLRLVREAGTPFAFVLSQADPRWVSTAEARIELAQRGRVAPTTIGPRVIYSDVSTSGQGVIEVGRGVAADEIHALWSYTRGILDGTEASETRRPARRAGRKLTSPAARPKEGGASSKG